MIYLAQAAPAPAAKDAGDETIEIRHNPETGETSLELEDVTALELAALALVAAVVIAFLVRGRNGERRR